MSVFWRYIFRRRQLDKLTNELVAFHADRIAVPEKIKGVELSEQ
jgi:hypothetical protein